MTVHRFFVPADEMAGDRFALPASIRRQARTVLRLAHGDRLVLMSGDGTQALCRLDGNECVVESREPVTSEPVHRLTITQALLRGDALAEVVQHGTEVGVARFRLFVGERSVVRDLSPRRLERLRAIAREAAEQSERGVVPEVLGPVRLGDVLGPASVVLFERHDAERLSDLPPPPDVVIGPEGGFSPAEVAAAKSAGSTLAGLGPRILRAESVAVAAAAVILSRTGDFA